MPGLVGFVKNNHRERSDALLKNMAHALEPEERFRVQLYQEGSVGLGRVSLDILNPEPQPVWNEERTICLVMEGEIYDYQEKKKQLADLGYRFRVDNDVEFALHMYVQYGDSFAAHLNGAFSIALWDSRDHKLLLANDRMGLHPLYYAQAGDGLIFASGVRALLADPALSREVDRIAIAHFLTFDYVLDDRTFLTSVKLLPQASQLIYRDGNIQVQPYWKLKYPDLYPLYSEETYLEQFLHLFRQAVERQSQGKHSFGILLSGGIDSRYLLGLLAETLKGKPFRALTWGIPGCNDLSYARELSKIVGVPHQFFELKPDWLLGLADEAVRITDGLGNIVNLHALASAKEESEYANVIYKGFLGDAMFGYPLHLRFWADYDDETRLRAHLQTHLDQGVITFLASEREAFFTQGFQRAIGDAVMERYRAAFDEARSSQLAIQRLYFGLRQRVPRMTINGVEVVRSYMAVRLPYADNDLLDFSLQLPPGLQFQRRLVKRAFTETYPNLAKVPCTPSNLPLIACFRDIRLRTGQLARWHLRARGLGRLAGPPDRPYNDYNNWFRTVLRNWVEATLLSSNALQRGYFNPEYLRKLVSEHMAGANHTVKLGALLSLELWHRQFID